jgi:hypothetical protein
MTLQCAHFLDHLELTNFLNHHKIHRERVLKIDADSSSGGWVLWWWEFGSRVSGAEFAIIKSKHFQEYTVLTEYINAHHLQPKAVYKVDADTSNGGWVLWWEEGLKEEK